MDYNSISGFLDKFKKLVFQKEETKEVVIKIIESEIHHSIEKKSVRIKNGCIYVEGSPILRNEILIYKKQILEKIKNVLLNSNFFDIR